MPALGGGLACGALHEIAAEREGEIPVATAFVLLAVKRFYNNLWLQFPQIEIDPDERVVSSPKGAVLWISEIFSFARMALPMAPVLIRPALLRSD